MPAARILVVQGDKALHDVLVEQLDPSPDFEICGCATGDEGRRVLQERPFDLALIDSDLPDIDGRDLIAQLRQDGFRGPALMMTSAASDPEGAHDPDSGASDTISKPFRFSALLPRIRALIRAHEASDEAAFAIGPHLCHPGAKSLVGPDGTSLKLTEKEVAILRYLHRAGSSTVSRDELLQEVFGYHADVTTHTLETHIYRLRQKLESDPSAARLLVTDPGGYRLMG
ncbi:response regulator transcription factor [Enterovirga rhinocerotis]|uniref:DNA-binding response OmpR family regulator n=1 Tax=Enterovirga rhinocerotis TaxID=1339210 RepID=A0A4R7BSZ3_9HYPH|nr:response regulator transcription factor [Enterovirga rhinocerotis]TDR87126.1 DNA-binding response OmpR family regulator [Enterovirga rhinocerotis]